jgi:hypothetical protein
MSVPSHDSERSLVSSLCLYQAMRVSDHWYQVYVCFKDFSIGFWNCSDGGMFCFPFNYPSMPYMPKPKQWSDKEYN